MAKTKMKRQYRISLKVRGDNIVTYGMQYRYVIYTWQYERIIIPLHTEAVLNDNVNRHLQTENNFEFKKQESCMRGPWSLTRESLTKLISHE